MKHLKKNNHIHQSKNYGIYNFFIVLMLSSLVLGLIIQRYNNKKLEVQVSRQQEQNSYHKAINDAMIQEQQQTDDQNAIMEKIKQAALQINKMQSNFEEQIANLKNSEMMQKVAESHKAIYAKNMLDKSDKDRDIMSRARRVSG